MNCFMCGCHENKACNHIDYGPCSWFADHLCSHCADAHILFATERPKGKDIIYPPLTTHLLKKYFRLVGIKNVSITTVSRRHHNAGHFVIELSNGKVDQQLEEYVDALFPDYEIPSPGTYSVDPANLIMRHEKKGVKA